MSPLHSMQKLAKVDQKAFEKACKDGVDVVKQCEQYMKTLKFENPKTIKDTVAATFAAVPGSKFESIKGTATVKSTLEKCLKYDHDYNDFGPNAPKEQRHGKACRWTYYLNDEQKADHEKMKTGEIADGAQYMCHEIMESPNSLVSKREFVMLRTTKDVSAAGKRRWIVVSKSAEFPDTFTTDKVVRGYIMCANLYEEDGDHVKITSWVHADPCGNVPAMIFNNMLDSQMHYVAALKRDLEK